MRCGEFITRSKVVVQLVTVGQGLNQIFFLSVTSNMLFEANVTGYD